MNKVHSRRKFSVISLLTLDSGIDVGQGINIGPKAGFVCADL